MRVKNVTVRSVREGYDWANLEIATVITSDPALYPIGSLMQQWAALVVDRAQPTIKGPLFRQAA